MGVPICWWGGGTAPLCIFRLNWSHMAGAGSSRTRISGFLFWRQLVSRPGCGSDRNVRSCAQRLAEPIGVCLRWVTPETIFLKGLALGKIDELLSEPNPGNTEWSAALRSWINRLDAMEREFAPCDTARFGSLPSRVRYFDNVKAKYPDCFTAPPIPEG